MYNLFTFVPVFAAFLFTLCLEVVHAAETAGSSGELIAV